jgi:hypothetical protein
VKQIDSARLTGPLLLGLSQGRFTHPTAEVERDLIVATLKSRSQICRLLYPAQMGRNPGIGSDDSSDWCNKARSNSVVSFFSASAKIRPLWRQYPATRPADVGEVSAFL